MLKKEITVRIMRYYVSFIKIYFIEKFLIAGLFIITCCTFQSSALAQAKGNDEIKKIDIEKIGPEIYHTELNKFRSEFGGTQDMPDVKFFLFGMGNRTKLIYKDGILKNSFTGLIYCKWKVKKELILPPEYSVYITTTDDKKIIIYEDKSAVWIKENDSKYAIPGTKNPLVLPTFNEYSYPQVMRVLLQEILINIYDGVPVPNYFVYNKPWYRDGAMMSMCLVKTGNINLIKDWILSLREPYDRNNAGETEADNLGQVLYMISLVSDKNHPLVKTILNELSKFEVSDIKGTYIKGRSDFAERPVYQTKWLKLGLKSLKLEDKYIIPSVQDSYSSLFWMDYKDSYVPGADADDRGMYPYLGWATDHFHKTKKSPVSNWDYPLTWEAEASQANYDGMKTIDDVFFQKKTSVPHTWHASEVFLYLCELKKQ
jgi:hypothetical protein